MAFSFVFLFFAAAAGHAATTRLSWYGHGLPGDTRYGLHSIIVGESTADGYVPTPGGTASVEVHQDSVYIKQVISADGASRVYKIDRQNGSTTTLYDIAHSTTSWGFAVTDDYLYLSDSLNDTITRSGLDGSNLETVYRAPYRVPSPTYLVASETQLFWAMGDVNTNGRGSIWTMDHSSPGTPTMLLSGLNSPRHLSLTSASIIWFDSGKIYRMNRDGTGLRTLVSSVSLFSLAVDEDFIYWSTDERVMRYDFRTGRTEKFLTVHDDIYMLYLDSIPEPGAWLLAGAGAVAVGVRRRRRGVIRARHHHPPPHSWRLWCTRSVSGYRCH